MRHTLGLVIALVLATGVTGCAADPFDRSDGTPAVPRHDDVLLSVYSTGVHGDPGPGVPDVEVHADGTAYVRTERPLGVDTFRLTEEGLDRVRELFADVAMEQGEYDEPDVTDQGTTTVYSALDGGPYEVSVYGLRTVPEYVDDGDWDDLIDALDGLESMAAEARHGPNEWVAAPRTPYRPERVRLAFTPAERDQVAEAGWPLDRPLDELDVQSYRPYDPASHVGDCVVVGGEQVDAVRRLLADPDYDGGPWRTGARPGSGVPRKVLVSVTPVLPHADDLCVPKGS